MAAPQFTLEGNPDLYISDVVAERALGLGIAALQTDRRDIEHVSVLAVPVGDGIPRIGAVLLSPARSLRNPFAVPHGELKHVPEDGNLQDALDSSRTYDYENLLASAQKEGINILAARVGQPTQNNLANSVYWAACTWTNRWASGQSLPGVSSRLDKWLGSASGGVLLGAADAFNWPFAIDLEIGGTPLPVVGGAFTGLAVGRMVVAPAFALLGKRVKANDLASTPPIHARYSA